MIPNTQAESLSIKANIQITTARIAITGANNIFKMNFIESPSFLLTIFYRKTRKRTRMPRSVDGGKLFKNAVVSFPKLFEHGFHFLNIILIDTVRGVHSTSDLIEVVACATEQRDHISEFGQIQFDHISVNSHFAKICRHVDSVSLCHAPINHSSFFRCYTEFHLNGSVAVCHYNSASFALLGDFFGKFVFASFSFLRTDGFFSFAISCSFRKLLTNRLIRPG
ncbi:Uncharacterised protein [Clostridioides difficile]|nr:Uncharacterised protein [Clostridioides difficile]